MPRFMTMSPFATGNVHGRILLVEDPSVLREIELLMLQRAGFDVLACADARQVLATMELHPFDLVVLNSDRDEVLTAPFVSALRQDRPNLSLLAFVGEARPERIDQLKCHDVTVCERSLNPAIMLKEIDTLLGSPPRPAPPKQYTELSSVDACRADWRTVPERFGSRAPFGHTASTERAPESHAEFRIPATGTIGTITTELARISLSSRRY